MEHTPSTQSTLDERNKRTSKFLIAVIVVMFLFGFASIPLYRMVCDAVDPGGSSASNGTTEVYQDVAIDSSRTLRVRLTANVHKSLPWEFHPMTDRVELHPGEREPVKFFAKSFESYKTRGKAVYDINPPEAGQYFKKIECFCFQEQELEAGEAAELPLIFWFDPEMPRDIREITVAYTFFNMESSFKKAEKNQ